MPASGTWKDAVECCCSDRKGVDIWVSWASLSWNHGFTSGNHEFSEIPFTEKKNLLPIKPSVGFWYWGFLLGPEKEKHLCTHKQWWNPLRISFRNQTTWSPNPCFWREWNFCEKQKVALIQCVSLLRLLEENIRLSGFNNRLINIFSQFWILEAQDQGVSRVGFFSGFSTWLINGYLLPVTLHGLLLVHICVLSSFSYEDTSKIGLEFTLMTSFNLNYLFKDPVSKYSHTLRY